MIAAFGIRGIGSLYYVAYALAEAPFPGAERIWAIVGLVVVLSVVVHGVTATPVMMWLDRRAKRACPPPAGSAEKADQPRARVARDRVARAAKA